MAVWGEIRGYNQYERIGPYARRARRAFWCREANVQALENYLYNKVHSWRTGLTPWWALRCEKVVVNHRALINDALVIAYYRTGPGASPVRVRFRLGSRTEKVLFDLDGKTVSGWDPDGTKEWKVIQGPDRVPVRAGMVEVAISRAPGDVSVDKLMSRIGRVNSNNMRMLGMAPGTAKLLGAPYSRIYEKYGTYQVVFVFEYAPDGWNNVTQSRPLVRIARDVPVYNAAGGDIDDTARVTDFMYSGVAESRRMYPGASFRDIDRLVALWWK